MKRLLLAFVAIMTMGTALAQTAQQVLDKCAALVSAPEGASANFTMTSAQYGNATGTISIKGQKFYMHSNVSTPTAQQLQTLNPYHFITLYQQGYTYTMTTSATAFTVHLTATDTQKKISEGFVTVDKTTYAPKEIKLLQGTKWTTFTVSGLKAERQDDAKFRFKSSDYPDAELIDLR